MIIFEDKKENIVDVLSKVEMIVRRNKSYEIFNCVRIDCEENRVIFTTTNSEWMFSQYLFTDVPNYEELKNKEIFINANQLLKVLRNAKRDDDITFTLRTEEVDDKSSETRLIVETSRSTYFLKTHELISEYNDLRNVWQRVDVEKGYEDFESKYVATCSVYDYLNSINLSAFSTSNEEYRPTLASVACQLSEYNFLMSATDAIRVASVRVPNADVERPDTEFLIPREIIPHITRAIKDQSDLVKNLIDFYVCVESNENPNPEDGKETLKCVFMNHGNGIIRFTPTTTTKFIDWRKISYEKKYNNNIVFDVKSMTDAITDVTLIKHKSNNILGVKFNCEEGYIKSVSDDVGEVISSFDIVSSTLDDDYKIFRFSYHIIQEALERVDTDNALFRYADGNYEAVILEPIHDVDKIPEQIVSDADMNYQFVLMPAHQRDGNEFEPKPQE